MSFLVATNVVASRPPERRPTETPHARANCSKLVGKWHPRAPEVTTGAHPQFCTILNEFEVFGTILVYLCQT